jgi:hypothetical protein
LCKLSYMPSIIMFSDNLCLSNYFSDYYVYILLNFMKYYKVIFVFENKFVQFIHLQSPVDFHTLNGYSVIVHT